MRALGIDLAWKDGPDAPESGVAALEPDGRVVDAGWTVGIEATVDWILQWSEADTVVFVDAPLWVDNSGGMRGCERAVGQLYGRWGFSANATNLASRRLGGVRLREQLEGAGFVYDDGLSGPPDSGRHVSECYPYTTICGVAELAYERPRYKRKPRNLGSAAFPPMRAAACDDLIARVDGLATVDPPLTLSSHPVTVRLVSSPSPLDDRAYKHREDLLDAVLCAWTAHLWLRHGPSRVQALHDPLETTNPQAKIWPRIGQSNSNQAGRVSPTQPKCLIDVSLDFRLAEFDIESYWREILLSMALLRPWEGQ